MSPDGLGGMVQAAAWLANLLDLEVLTFGRAGLAPAHSCKLEIAGAHLLYDVTLDGGWIHFAVAAMDRGDPAEHLMSVADNPESWQTLCRFIAALERSGVRSLQPRPLRIGTESGPNSWVIG